MTPQILELLIILGVALVFFSFEWVSADVIALAVLLALILSGFVPPERAFAGFGSATVITILGLLILTAGLVRTGVVDAAGRLLLARTGKDSRRVLLTIMAAAALLSVFISNTAATAFFLPVVIGGAALTRTSAGRLLAAAGLRLDYGQFGHPDQQLHQPPGQRPDDPVWSPPDRHV